MPKELTLGWYILSDLWCVCVCVLSLKLLSLWLAAEGLQEAGVVFAARRAGADTGAVGTHSAPISHLAETMRALLHTSPPRAVIPLVFHLGRRKKKIKGGLRECCLLTRQAGMEHILVFCVGKHI